MSLPALGIRPPRPTQGGVKLSRSNVTDLSFSIMSRLVRVLNLVVSLCLFGLTTFLATYSVTQHTFLPTACLSVYLSVSLSVCPSACLSFTPGCCPSVCISLDCVSALSFLLGCLSVCVSSWPSCLSAFLLVYL